MKKIISVLLIFILSAAVMPAYADSTPPYEYASFIGDWSCYMYGHTTGMTGTRWLKILSADDNSILMSVENGLPKTYTIRDNKIYTEIAPSDDLNFSLPFNSDFCAVEFVFCDDSIKATFTAENRTTHEKTPYEYWFTSENAHPERKGSNSYSVVLNGQTVEFDQKPVMVNNRILVPMRKIFEELGATVDWDSENRVVTGTKGNMLIQLKIGYPVIYYCADTTSEIEELRNGYEQDIDTPPILYNGYTLVPVRVVSEAFNASVNWDADTQTVIIKTGDTNEISIDVYDYINNLMDFCVVDTVTTTLETLEDGIKTALERIDIPVKSITCTPGALGYDVIIDLDDSAKNMFNAYYKQDAVRETMFSVDEIYRYAIYFDGDSQWRDGMVDKPLGDWHTRTDYC